MRTNHINVSVHYVQELEEIKRSPYYIQVKKMLADMLIKPLKKVRYIKNVDEVGLRAP